jgi:hypothetical protein
MPLFGALFCFAEREGNELISKSFGNQYYEKA